MEKENHRHGKDRWGETDHGSRKKCASWDQIGAMEKFQRRTCRPLGGGSRFQKTCRSTTVGGEEDRNQSSMVKEGGGKGWASEGNAEKKTGLGESCRGRGSGVNKKNKGSAP